MFNLKLYENFINNKLSLLKAKIAQNLIFNKAISKRDYKLPSNNIVQTEGYEHIVLDTLLKKYKEADIIIDDHDIEKEIGKIFYTIKGVKRLYIPDIYIKSEHKIIEVKSEFVYNIKKEKNILKANACIEQGFNFEFYILNKLGKKLELDKNNNIK